MAVLKAQCPECDAKIRLTVDGPGTHTTECPKCGHKFKAKAEADATASANAPAKKSAAADAPKKTAVAVKETTKGSAAAKKSKAAARDDDDDDDAPKKKKKKGGDTTGDDDARRKKLLIAGGAAGVLLLGGLVAVVLAVTSKDKTAKTTPTADPPAVTDKPAPAPVVQPKPDQNPKQDNTKVNSTKVETKVAPKKPNPKEESFPPPVRWRIDGSLVPEPVKLDLKVPVIPPLAADEDPFARAKNFVPDEKLPELPKLPERGVRPILALDAGGHTAFVLKVFFTPDGKRIITVSKDKSVRIWDPATGETVKTVRFPAGPGDEGSLRAATLSKDGKKLAVAGERVKGVADGKVPIFIVSSETGALIRRIDAASSDVNCMDFSSDGRRLAVGCANTFLQVFDVTTGGQLGRPGGVPLVGGLELKFDPQDKSNVVASLGPGGNILVVDVIRGTNTEFKVTAGPASKLAWSNDGKFLAVGCSNGVIVVYNRSLQPVTTMPAITAAAGKNSVPVEITELAWLKGDRDMAVIGYHRYAGIIDAASGAEVRRFALHPNTVFSMDVSPDGKKVVSCGGNHHDALIWSAEDAKLLHRLAGTGSSVRALAWSKDGKSIAWGTQDVPRKGPDDEGELEFSFRLDELGLGDKPDPTKYVHTVKSDDGVALHFGNLGGIQGFVIKTPGREEELLIPPARERIYSATLLPKGNALVAGGIEKIYLINPAKISFSSNPFVGHTGNVLAVTPSPDGRFFATGSNDQTIRIWRRDQEEPILSIFVAGRDWVAWTTQGYYTCSPQGERLMAWQVNPGTPGNTTRVPTTHPAERFRKSLYQPALLKYIVPAGDLRLAMAMAKKFDGKLVELGSVADVLPPEVTLDGFGDTEVKVEKDTLTIKATAKSAKQPITSMRLLINGRPFQKAAGAVAEVRKFAKPDQTAEATWEVPLDPGTHTVAVIADTGVSRGMSRLGVAVRSGDPPKPSLYLLAMGVSQYAAGVNPLNFCATDAEMLAKAFKEYSKNVFDKIEVKVLTDKQCTKKGMLEGLDWLKSKMTPKDVGIVSFSGHGTRDIGGRFYLVPIDIDPADAERTCFPGDVLKDRLENMPGRLVAILDACHSGGAADDGKHSARTDSLVSALTAEDSGVIVMCASLGREYAIEHPACAAGFYSLGLKEGLQGYGDADGDGVVYLHELDLYATKRVRQLSEGRQNPTFSRPSSVRPFVISKPDKPVD
jgi:WD40 repeat protein